MKYYVKCCLDFKCPKRFVALNVFFFETRVRTAL